MSRHLPLHTDFVIGHANTVSCLSFSKDGQLLASGGMDACVKIWDILGNLKWTFQGPAKSHEFEVGRKQLELFLIENHCAAKG